MKEQQKTILHEKQNINTHPNSKQNDLGLGITVCAIDGSEIFALSHRLLASCTALVVLLALVILVDPELRETDVDNDFLAKQSCSGSIATRRRVFVRMIMAHWYLGKINVEQDCGCSSDTRIRVNRGFVITPEAYLLHSS